MRNGSTPFSSSASHAARTSPTSRLPQASESAHAGDSRDRHREQLDLPRADLLASRPGGELLHLLLEERRCRRRRSRRGAWRRRRSPARPAARTRSAPRRTGPSASGCRTRAPRRPAGPRALPSASSFGGSSATSASTAPSHRLGEIARERLDVRLLPAARPPGRRRAGPRRRARASSAPPATSSPETAVGAQHLDRLVAEPRPQPAERAADLRAVGPGQEVGREEVVRHAAKSIVTAPSRTESSSRPTRRSSGRPRRSGRRRGREASRVASVDGAGCP